MKTILKKLIQICHMNTGRTFLLQLLNLIPRHEFNKFIGKYKGTNHVKSFISWKQFIVMGFAQLTSRESLRDIEACLVTIQTRLYHLGLKSKLKRSGLSDTNNN